MRRRRIRPPALPQDRPHSPMIPCQTFLLRVNFLILPQNAPPRFLVRLMLSHRIHKSILPLPKVFRPISPRVSTQTFPTHAEEEMIRCRMCNLRSSQVSCKVRLPGLCQARWGMCQGTQDRALILIS